MITIIQIEELTFSTHQTLDENYGQPSKVIRDNQIYAFLNNSPEKLRATFINLMGFFQGLLLLTFGFSFLDFFPLAEFKLSVILGECTRVATLIHICLFKDLCLLFLPNVPEAMFIQGATSIPYSKRMSLS